MIQLRLEGIIILYYNYMYIILKGKLVSDSWERGVLWDPKSRRFLRNRVFLRQKSAKKGPLFQHGEH